jgi:hypothetical protein
MKEIIALCLTSFLLGFVAAYGFDTWLSWRDDRKWR